MFIGPSNTAGKVESAFLFIVSASVILLALVTFCMVLFLVKYNRKRHPQAEDVKESLLLEILWTVIPTVLVLVMFYIGWVNFSYIRKPPTDSMLVNVIARQWSWSFKYENGKQADVLRVPINKPVKLILTSADVIHSLYIPAFRIKEDCVPGLQTHLWFTGNEMGTYDIFCTEYCGVGHSRMRSKVIIMSQQDFEKWYSGAEITGPAGNGLKLLQDKGCLGCHSTDGTKKIGPTFKEIFGRKETVLTGGKERQIVVDEAYLKRSVLEPQADIVKGYPPIMPTIPVTEDELSSIITYLKGSP
ncbi:MAG: cytochrome c oxidase subunit II [Dissulfurispiraceae bacterium]